MSTTPIFKGIIPPVSTVFDENGDFDQQGTARLIEFLLNAGVNGLFFLGTGGEFSQMSVAGRKEVAEFATKYIDGRVPVLIGTGSASTDEVIELSLHAKDVGADGVVVINPYYWPLTNDNLRGHYVKIAEAVDLPILLYNFPNLTGQDLSPEFVRDLASSYSHIVGIKETVDTAGHIREMILKVKSVRPDFAVFAGFDDHLFNTMALGGDGAISASANYAPELTIGIYQACLENDYENAVNLHRQLAPLPLMYKLDSPFVNVIKEAIVMRGLQISTHVLAPASPLSDENKEELRAILKMANLL
ncbi:dihydrodipicolinate synthase family protein [Cytobacillus sp. S13-E01]|uniref:dihydrodipicolinate synthase family protein n=1 Tax=Cytobacillus sp. S13-E01 TaxID=3031326 RepID=UPI0023D8AB06|nr:dihydrodipicolinate synthase family protein [Cytobacillus sp. S13-E01]MDF0727310.1 dihydrodipicolinate synthase family protein [Cytobacillus sp. S13-E01]